MRVTQTLKSFKQHLVAFCQSGLERLGRIGAIAIFLFSLVMVPAHAIAASYNPVLATGGNTETGRIEKERAKSEIDRMQGSGMGDRVEGRAREAVGSVKERVGDLTDNSRQRADGIADQAEGLAKRQFGQAKSSAENAQAQAEDSAKGLIDSVKDFFE